MVALGALVGGVVATRLMPRAADGWTQIAQALGGLMLGGLIGLVVGVGLAFVLSPAALLRGGVAILACVAVLFAVLLATRPMRDPNPPDSSPGGPASPKPSMPTDASAPAAGAGAEARAYENDGGSDGHDESAGRGSPTRLPCTPTPDRRSAVIAGRLQAGDGFRESFGPGWQLDFLPLPPAADATYPAGTGRGWQVRILEHDPPSFEPHPDLQPVAAAVRDLAGLTPPLRGPNPRFIEAAHFLNAAGDGPNDGSVNAPQHLRPLLFAPEVGRGAATGTAPTGDDLERVGAFGRAGILLTDVAVSELPPAAGETAGIERITFEACLTWPRHGALSEGALRIAPEHIGAFDRCGLREPWRIAVRLDPTVLEADLDADGTPDLAALVRRPRDGALALALCRRGPGRLDLIGPDEGLGELDPAYYENVDWWSADAAGVTLGKEGASSVLVTWDGAAWQSVWQGD